MISVGNDIVDLKTPEAKGKARDIRFLEKVLTEAERRAVTRFRYPDALLWAFWAAKEAAYKAMVKSTPDISSAPGRYAVKLDTLDPSGTIPGWVTTPLGKVPVMMEWNADYVHARVAAGSPEALEAVISGSSRIPEDAFAGGLSLSERETLAAQTLAAACLSRFLGVCKNTIAINRPSLNGRDLPPEICIQGEKQAIDLSLSHDGRFAAFAFYIPPMPG